ncbi:Glycosylphosphatidylinositol:protein transamidase, GAA1 component [Paraphaeosphaeria sporulosa]|uniref:Glycosylphosphatidylinositol:protein transamidase, GAA1 component n=1 Tax=Paraphaeosphaeria sporulosa TaxID=1460663 RepID=A0A177BXV1_9PLEO|nr:Glycosylphosphatidylinositol:protein transamidase, GAA1 component [Paraphaeosphaeria sporulosa]OAF99780.1 Glycosylphosphatidylinositol:protein transamidase, GAA1 component [Paraphaeosphaeria sporulosa]
MALLATLLALRKDARILKIPPYLSAFLILVGVAWLLVLPLKEYSRGTYVSENALLPGQVHTYFTGSEHNVFRAYRHEVAGLVDLPVQQRTERLSELLRASNLKVATQKYTYTPSGRNISDENVYAILQGPRADATEAIVLMASLKTMAGEHNYSGVALVLALARYFKRWSLWSKDIIFLVSGDSTSGPQAWVDAYHDAHDPATIESLSIKSGALQGAVGVEYPAGPWGHRYDKLHIVYDGTNGQLPNLDLFNTAVNIASGQMGIGCTLQRMWHHRNSYQERLQTMLRGMLSQGLGHATGPHSAFIPYHVDAITLVTVGDGWHDEMGLGRTVESLFRSLNNLLEHLHQSFFFYLLLEAKRFVSIGTYLPSAMLIAANFSIMAIALWVQSGRPQETIPNPAAAKPAPKSVTQDAAKDPDHKEKEQEQEVEEEPLEPPPVIVTKDGATAIIPAALLQVSERPLFLPAAFVVTAHFLGLIPLAAFNHIPVANLYPSFLLAANLTALLPLATAYLLSRFTRPTPQESTLIHCFSLLFLGMYLSALATLNFSQSLMVGLLTAPLSFVRRSSGSRAAAKLQFALLAAINPVMVVYGATYVGKIELLDVLVKAAEGWHVWGMWTQVVVWLVWWPAWFSGSVVVALGLF